MAVDALDPGEDWSFTRVPRTRDGYLDTARMPIGQREQRSADGSVYLIDVTPTVQDRHGRTVPITAVVPPPPAAAQQLPV